MRAYAQNATAAGLDPVARQAWQWFVTEVPQRSLHNWQNAAARLIAADLRGNLVAAQDSAIAHADLRLAAVGSVWCRSGSGSLSNISAMTAITTRPVRDSTDSLLRFALRADATLCAALGLLIAMAADPLSRLSGPVGHL